MGFEGGVIGGHVFGRSLRAVVDGDQWFSVCFIDDDDIGIDLHDRERSGRFRKEFRLGNLFVSFFRRFRFVFRSIEKENIAFFQSFLDANVFVECFFYAAWANTVRSPAWASIWRRRSNTRIKSSRVDGGPAISVGLAFEIDSKMVLGKCTVKERKNGEVPAVLCTCVLYEDVSGWT